LLLAFVVPVAAFAAGDAPAATATITSATTVSASGSPFATRKAYNSKALTGPFSLSGAPGTQVGPVNIEFENVGTATWTTANGVQLHSSATNTFFSLGNCDNLTPRSACTWSVTYTLGSTPGTVTDHWQMYNGTKPFGATITVTITIT